jgi:glycogen(starch) synthase
MTSSGKTRLCLIGALPPTIGGVSVHMERLARCAADAGLDVTAYDVYSKGIANLPTVAGVQVYSGRGVIGKCLLLFHLATATDIAHLHLSAASKCIRIFLLLQFVSMFTRAMVTIHSGAFPAELAALGRLKKTLIVLGLNRCTSVICVSDRLAISVGSAGIRRSRIQVIPAFIPPDQSEDPSPRNAGADLAAPPIPKVCASGYATPIYGWHTLLDAIDRVNSTCEYHLAFYNEFEEPYFGNLLSRVRERANIKVHRNLTPEAFSALLSSCDLFIRPTTTDGDSIAVREAIYFGKGVIASNAVPRPDGCALFDTESAEDLAAQIAGFLAGHAATLDGLHGTDRVDRIGAADAIVCLYRREYRSASNGPS